MASDNPTIDILLAIYNGERFLAELIESILKQDYKQIRLVIRDDGSTDSSLAIVESFIKTHPEQIVLLNDSLGNLGSTMNFFQLLQSSRAGYAMLADQDDVWLPKKVSITIAAMKKTEDLHGQHTPILIHTDLIVTDYDLSKISGSFWMYQKIDPKHDSINRLMVQNVVTGCTVMVNRSLMKLVRPVSQGVIEHDWWLALLAASFGKISHISKPTILYRQHDKNIVGAVKWDAWATFRKFCDHETKASFVINLKKTHLQAARFLQMYEPILPQDVAWTISRYAMLDQLNYFTQLMFIFKHRFFKVGIKRNIGMLLSLSTYTKH